LQQGGWYVFEHAYHCYINLYDCTSTAWNNEIEQIKQREEAANMDTVEVIDIDESYQ
jgi:CMP-N-acetylneuraminic acid synthetase